MKRLWFIIVLLILSSCTHYREIKQDPVFTLGSVVGIAEGARGGFGLLYIYKANGRLYKKQSSTFYKCKDKFINKKFPVVYYHHNPKHSLLLVTPYDYLKWNLVYPDSLAWVYICSRGDFLPKTLTQWKIKYLQPPFL